MFCHVGMTLTPHRGSAPGLRWGTSIPKHSYHLPHQHFLDPLLSYWSCVLQNIIKHCIKSRFQWNWFHSNRVNIVEAEVGR